MVMNSGFLENIKQAKGNEYRRTAAIFSSSLPICPVYFESMLCTLWTHWGYITYWLACYVRLQVQNMPYYMRLRVQNMLGCQLRKYGWAKGQTGGINRRRTFVLTAFISFGLFNNFPGFPRQWTYLGIWKNKTLNLAYPMYGYSRHTKHMIKYIFLQIGILWQEHTTGFSDNLWIIANWRELGSVVWN
jgi:hypothetical protein